MVIIIIIVYCLLLLLYNTSLSDMMKQAIALSHKPHVVIATPGRLADHLRSTDTLSLKKIQFLVSNNNHQCNYTLIIAYNRHMQVERHIDR